jgi:hypothetical protein
MTAERPILIDEQDGPCPYCRDWAKKKDGRIHHCDECGKEIPLYPGNFGNGIEAVMPHHYHLRPIHGGPAGRVGVRQELCLECYVAHREKYFPPDQVDSMGQYPPTAVVMLAGHEERRLRDEGRSPLSP